MTMDKMKTLYFGGQKSGKSNLAEKKALALANEKKPYYIATYDNSFNDVHIKGAKNLIEACSFNDISKLIQVSAIGVEQNKLSKYAITKFKAEKIIQSYLETYSSFSNDECCI